MAKKQTVVASEVFTPAETKELTTLYADIRKDLKRGKEKWNAVRLKFTVAGLVIAPLKKLASVQWTQEWIASYRADVKREMTLDEVTREKKYAQNEFSRGTKDPNAPVKARTPAQQRAAEAKAAAAEAAKKAQEAGETGAGDAQPLPSTVAAIEALATRSKAIQANLVAFQNHITAAKVRIPELGVQTLGELSDDAAKMYDEILAIVKIFKA